MGENKFKAGDRVVAESTIGGLTKGKTYTVESEALPTGGGELRWVNLKDVINEASSDGSFRETEFVAASHDIQKGDKFRVNINDIHGGYENGDIFVCESADSICIKFYDNDGYNRLINTDNVTLVDDFGDPWDYKPTLKVEAGKSYLGKSGTIYNIVDNSDNSSWPLCSDHEPFGTRHFWKPDGEAWKGHVSGGDNLVADAPTLRIEAGKFYKTRDGRKVGPMREHFGSFIEKAGDARIWSPTGANLGVDQDLIAEWVDEPAPAKFKVGDRVDIVGNKPGLVSKIGQSGTIDESLGGKRYSVKLDVGGSFTFADEELAPRIGATSKKAAEPDTTLSVKITADTAELDAEIDRIKRRLKKLSKKARKFGLSLDYDLAS